MSELKFIRDKKFNGLLVPVFILLDDLEQPIGVIKNGKTLIITLEGSHQIRLAWQVSTDPKDTYKTSEPVFINEANLNRTILIKNKYSFKHGSIFYLEQA